MLLVAACAGGPPSMTLEPHVDVVLDNPLTCWFHAQAIGEAGFFDAKKHQEIRICVATGDVERALAASEPIAAKARIALFQTEERELGGLRQWTTCGAPRDIDFPPALAAKIRAQLQPQPPMKVTLSRHGDRLRIDVAQSLIMIVHSRATMGYPPMWGGRTLWFTATFDAPPQAARTGHGTLACAE